ncbi:Serine/threonine protein kinase [Promicromonospora umidemergens]|uniref:non-specific serine/threonine protein kinase n=1 Tax=Promicromonospora umidemergens TaxID=629679 RepID=A0ABP8WCW8_9MICO|nr:serine/threonine-protein kinase [Promicromonospora umidemergens]MCP2285909.1 Serine/threonine protein kinase [Promicromonospora umidemergens]
MNAGDVVGERYRLERRLGAGGQGEVWEASDLNVFEQRVALKRAHAIDVEGDRRLEAEAEKLARIRHPNVVRVHDVVRDGDSRWIVMELLSGTALADCGRVSALDAARYGAQLADGLAAAHAEGILHRDVKPSNVLITEDGVAKLVDFGLARSKHSATTLTSADAIAGTPGFVAPEALDPGRPYTAASEVFALGATLFHATEGTTPWGAGSVTELIVRTSTEEVRSSRRAGDMTAVLARMLSRNPKDRPGLTAARDELRLIADGHGPSPAPASQHRLRILVAGAIALVLVVAGVVTAPLLADGQPDAASSPSTSPSEAGSRTRAPKPSPKPSAEDASEAKATPAPEPRATEQEPAEKTEPAPEAEARAALTQRAFAGGEKSADPCGLLGTRALGAFGGTRLDTDNDVFNQCEAVVTGSGTESAVKLTLYRGVEDLSGDQGTLNGLPVYRDDHELPESCDRDLVVDDYRVAIDAMQRDGESDLCGMAETAARRAAALISAEKIPSRAAARAGTFLGLDACALPGADALRAALSVDDLPSSRSAYGAWDCVWDGDDSREVRLFFQREEPLGSDEGERVTYSGHPVFLQGDRWEEGCLASVVGNQGKSPDGDGQVAELVRVHVTGGESSTDELCEATEEVARSVAAALPAR